MTDFSITGSGTIYLLRPITDAAHDWVEQHIPDDAMWLGGQVAVEHRYVDDIVEGFTAEGLTL